MTYKDRFVVAIKCNNRILREIDGFVTLPFGSEYSILLKNLNSRKSLVSIHIDGQDVLGGRSLIIDPMQSVELDNYIDWSLMQGFKFKFVQKTEKLIQQRGDRIDDGMIRIEFRHELPYQTTEDTRLDMTLNLFEMEKGTVDNIYAYMGKDHAQEAPIGEDEGITIKGSPTEQKFAVGTIGPLESSPKVIVVRLKGHTGGKRATSPLTVKDKLKCPECRKFSRSDKKFCSECGTKLQ